MAFGHGLEQMRKESTGILCFSSRLGTSTKKKGGGGGTEHRSEPRGSILETSKESGSISSPQLSLRVRLKRSGPTLHGGDLGTGSPDTGLGVPQQVPRLSGGRQEGQGSVESTWKERKGREGEGKDRDVTHPRLHSPPPAPGSSALCSGGDEN